MVQTNLPALLLSSFAAFIFLVLLAIVLMSNTKSLLSRVFCIFLLSCFAWGLFEAFMALNSTPQAENIANIACTVLGFVLVETVYFFFCLIYLGKEWRYWLFYAVPIYFLISYWMITGQLTTIAAHPFPGGAGFHARQLPGPMLNLASTLGFSILVILFFYLIWDLVKKRGDKIQLQKARLLLFASVGGGGSLYIYTNFPIFWAYPLDILGELVVALFLTYAILKFELVDVSTKLRNLIVELSFTGILAFSYLASLLFVGFVFKISVFSWFTVFLAIFIVSFSQPLKERLLKLVDVTFYRTRYDYRETIGNFSRRVGEILDLNELSLSIKKTLKDTFQAREVYLFVRFNETYRSLHDLPLVTISTKSQFVSLMRSSNKIFSWEGDSRELIMYPEARLFPFKLLIPLTSGKDLVALLFIDKRVSGDFYTSEDKSVLTTLANSSAIALKNSIFYAELLEKNKDIQNLLEHEREVNENKDQFISIASHFLRTPLTTIKGFLYLLLNSKLSKEERDNYLNRAFNEQKRLSNLVEDLISISALEKGELNLYKVRLSLSTIIQKINSDYSSVAKEKGIDLKIAIKKEVFIEGDEQKLTQAVLNLVDNAIKFTSIGSVTVLVDVEGDRALICVKDTGIGIEEQQVKQLFQKFHRATSVRTYNYEGSGLGLYITKLIVDAHQGQITVNSKLGIGSSFCIYLPLGKKA